MKINKIQDINLSKYKIAYYVGESLSSYDHCQDDVMILTDGGSKNLVEKLRIALIPKKNKLQECSGDDWNDHNAQDNASGFYNYPKGTIFLEGYLGEELTLVKEFNYGNI